LNVFSLLEHTYPRAEHFDYEYKNLNYKDFKKQVRDAVASLPEECRRIFMLSRFNGMKYNEIAKFLNISVKTVETQVSIALHKLRMSLKDYLPVLVILSSFLIG
jgi:RNA polymerase sigma-70 factor (ECF subfamily)